MENSRVKSADSILGLGNELYHLVVPSRSLEHEVSRQGHPRFRAYI